MQVYKETTPLLKSFELLECKRSHGYQYCHIDLSGKLQCDFIATGECFNKKGGSKFRYFQIMPTPKGVPLEVLNKMAEEAFSRIGAAHHRVDVTKHPAMHKTETIDYIILLKGDVTLILDEEEVKINPFDVVVQRGTNHAWVNNGSEPALLIAVLIDSELAE